MITKNKIIDIWKKQGWNNVSDYYNDLKSYNLDSINLLDPDKVSSRAFWKATDRWFNTDTVCNGYINKTNSSSISQANYTNNKIAQHHGYILHDFEDIECSSYEEALIKLKETLTEEMKQYRMYLTNEDEETGW